MTFVPTILEGELWTGEMVGIEVRGKRVVLLRVAGEVHAYEDRCPHLGVRLSRGTLRDSILTCSAHHYQFDATSGMGINPRAVCLRALPIRVTAGQILVELNRESLDSETNRTREQRRE